MTKEEVLEQIQGNLEKQSTEEINALLFGVTYLRKEDGKECIAQIVSGSIMDIDNHLYEIAKAMGHDEFAESSKAIIEALQHEIQEEDGNG